MGNCSDALAAVNIAAPLFVFAAGIGLMFMGGGNRGIDQPSPGKERVANINATQATLVSFIDMTIVIYPCHGFPDICGSNLGFPKILSSWHGNTDCMPLLPYSRRLSACLLSSPVLT